MKRRDAKWASDDTTNALLEDVLNETADAAQQEARARQEAQREREAHAAAAEREAEGRAQLEARARLARETQRQAQAAQRRTATLRAITAVDMSTETPTQEHDFTTAQATCVAPHPFALHAPAPSLTPPVATHAATAPAQLDRTPRRLIAALLSVAAMLSVSIGALLIGRYMPSYAQDMTPYPKVVMQPATYRAPVTSVAVESMPRQQETSTLPAAAAVSKPTKPRHTSPRLERPAPDKKPPTPDLLLNLDSEHDALFGTMDAFKKP